MCDDVVAFSGSLDCPALILGCIDTEGRASEATNIMSPRPDGMDVLGAGHGVAGMLLCSVVRPIASAPLDVDVEVVGIPIRCLLAAVLPPLVTLECGWWTCMVRLALWVRGSACFELLGGGAGVLAR